MQDRLFIGGEWVRGSSGAMIDVIDPATEAVVHRVAAGNAADIDRAVASAAAAYPAWRATGAAERARLLRAIAAGIEAQAGALARLEVLDNGKPLAEAEGDIADAVHCFELYADLAEQLAGGAEREVALPDARFSAVVRREPIGVVGQIIPWNYPLLMAAWKVAPALAAGCAIVLKPSEYTPLTALELAAIADQAGLPPGVLNVVTGTGPEAGAPLVIHPAVRKLAFTGSVPTGAKIATAAAAEIKAVSLELGGKSPLLVFDDADVDAAVEWTMMGIFFNQGQVCSATSRLLVQSGIAPTLLEKLQAATAKIKIGPGLDEGVRLGPLVSRPQYEKVLAYVEEGRRVADCIAGGKRPPGMNTGYFIEPTIFDEVPEDARIWREEIFGPVLSVRRFRDEVDAVRMANDSEYGLAAAVMSADEARTERIARMLEAGIVWINCSQPTFAELPWGGMKKSGIGRELGEWGLSNYLETKQITRYRSAERFGWYLPG